MPAAAPWELDSGRPNYVPRVRYGKIVLSPASWLLDRSELVTLQSHSASAQLVAIQALREGLRWPRWIRFIQGDQYLVVDLDNALSVQSLLPLLKGQEKATFAELLPEPGRNPIHGPEGRFAHQMIVPFVSSAVPVTRNVMWGRSAAASTSIPPAQRLRHPGSEWTTLKLYTHPASVDDVLTAVIEPLTRDWTKSGAIDSWFFIRYHDPESHVRFRVRRQLAFTLSKCVGELEKRLEATRADSKVWKLQCESYDREIERYGGELAIGAAERVFQLDSEFAIEVLQSVLGRDLSLRWIVAAWGADSLLEAFGLRQGDRREFFKLHRSDCWRALECNGETRRRLALKYRAERPKFDAIFDESSDLGGPLRQVFKRRRTSLAVAGADYHRVSDEHGLSAPLAHILRSFIHMHLNRMVPTQGLHHELVISDFIVRWYDSKIARLGAVSKTEASLKSGAGAMQ